MALPSNFVSESSDRFEDWISCLPWALPSPNDSVPPKDPVFGLQPYDLAADSTETSDYGESEIAGFMTELILNRSNAPGLTPQTLPTNSGTTQSRPCPGDVERYNLCTLFKASLFENSAHSSTKDETEFTASFASGVSGENSLQENGTSNNNNNPNLGIEDGIGAKPAANPQPRPLICWYSAAGIACTAKYVKTSTEVRHLWNDHAWGKNRKLPNHRLSDACQRCKRLFLTQQLLEEHVRDIEPQEPCRVLSSVELEELNREPNGLGISLERKEAIDNLRNCIDKAMKSDTLPPLHSGETMTLLKRRVDSNVLLYINGSNTSEKTARSQLWKWYLIFKQLRPDDEVPRNPFVSAQQPAGLKDKAKADAHLMFMRNLDQEECLSGLNDDQRTALGRVFLNTVEMLGVNQANNGPQSVQSTTKNPRKRPRLSPS